MAIILCDQHGKSAVAFVSPRVADAVNRSAKAEAEEPGLEVLTLRIDMGPGVPGSESKHPVDREFVRELEQEGHLAPGTLLVAGEDEGWVAHTKLVPVCGQCLREWESKTATDSKG